MKSFPDGMTRGTVVALLVHGLALVLIGGLSLDVALYSIKHPRGTGAPMWRLYTAGTGWALAIATGALITVFTIMRLERRFHVDMSIGLSTRMKVLFIVEGTILFLHIGGGETGGWILLWSMVLNLALLGFFGRVPVSVPKSESGGQEAAN